MVDPQDFVGNGWAGVWSEQWVAQAEAVIVSLGFELADLEREPGGLLRISIDSPDGIAVKDCEKVSHQLTHLFTVENVTYERLEVSSPGVDRVLRRRQDFERFVGAEVSIKLKRALENQKNFTGVLAEGSGSDFSLEIQSDKNNEEARLLNFDIADLAAARLVPHLKF